MSEARETTKAARRGHAAERWQHLALRQGDYDATELSDAIAAKLAKPAPKSRRRKGVPKGFPTDDTSRWVPIGPSVVRRGQGTGRPRVVGRVRDLAVSPDGKRAYAASARGGVWYSGDGGGSWSPVGGWADRTTAGLGTGGANTPSPAEPSSSTSGPRRRTRTSSWSAPASSSRASARRPASSAAWVCWQPDSSLRRRSAPVPGRPRPGSRSSRAEASTDSCATRPPPRATPPVPPRTWCSPPPATVSSAAPGPRAWARPPTPTNGRRCRRWTRGAHRPSSSRRDSGPS